MNTAFIDDFYDPSLKLPAISKKAKEQSWSLHLPAVLQRISMLDQRYLVQPSPTMVVFLTALVFYAVTVYYGFMNFNAILYIIVVQYLPHLS